VQATKSRKGRAVQREKTMDRKVWGTTDKETQNRREQLSTRQIRTPITLGAPQNFEKWDMENRAMRPIFAFHATKL